MQSSGCSSILSITNYPLCPVCGYILQHPCQMLYVENYSLGVAEELPLTFPSVDMYSTGKFRHKPTNQTKLMFTCSITECISDISSLGTPYYGILLLRAVFTNITTTIITINSYYLHTTLLSLLGYFSSQKSLM